MDRTLIHTFLLNQAVNDGSRLVGTGSDFKKDVQQPGFTRLPRFAQLACIALEYFVAYALLEETIDKNPLKQYPAPNDKASSEPI